MTLSDRHKDIYRRVIAAVSEGKPSTLDDLLAPDLVDHNPVPDQPPGRDGFKAWMAAARSSFPDFSGTVEAVLGEDDLVAGHVIWRGTHRGPFLGLPPSGREVSIDAFHIVRFSSERIAEWWGNADLLGVVNQIGGRIKPSD